jgi:hypothetical protein
MTEKLTKYVDRYEASVMLDIHPLSFIRALKAGNLKLDVFSKKVSKARAKHFYLRTQVEAEALRRAGVE